jgi:CxxC motif-containing protein
MKATAPRIQEITCIGCPNGCQVAVTLRGNDILSIEGNLCPTGENYAKAECTNPQRMLTTLMTPTFDGKPIAVRTSGPVPKDKIELCLKKIHAFHPKAPVAIGDVLIENLADLGVDVIATRHSD